MTPQQPTSKDLAEKLARKCALEFVTWAKDDKHPLAAQLEQIVLTQTALPELLECAEVLRLAKEDVAATAILSPSVGVPILGRLNNALTALDAKLKEIGV